MRLVNLLVEYLDTQRNQIRKPTFLPVGDNGHAADLYQFRLIGAFRDRIGVHSMSHVVQHEVASTGLRRISWGAIIAGAILALVLQVMFGLLGLGIGLATVDPETAGGPSARALTSGAGIYAALTILIATFAGGYTAARMAGSYARRDAVLHGIIAWAVATLVAVYLVASGASAVVTGTFGAVGSVAQSIGGAAGAVVPDSLDDLPPQLQSQAEGLLAQGEQQAQQTAQDVQGAAQDAAQDARQAVGTQDTGTAVREIFAGVQTDATPDQRQAAVQVIASQAGISEAEAEARLTEFQGQYQAAVEEVQQAAGVAADAVSATAFAAFVVMLLGLIVGGLGGLVGRPEKVHSLYS